MKKLPIRIIEKVEQDPNPVYFQSESQKKKIGRRVLGSTRSVFLFHVLILVSSFFVGIGIVSQMGSSKAATNYRIATNGSDSNPCTSTQPCLTMNRAYQVASAGDTVEMANGSYGSQTITGTKSSWVYFRPVSGATVTLGGLITNADFVDVSNVTTSEWKIDADNVNDVTMHNVTVKGYLGYSGNGTKRISMYGGSVGPGVDYHPQIAPSNGNGSGWATDLLFDGVRFHDWSRTNTGVHIECLQIAGTTNTTVRNSTFENCAVFDLSFALYNGSGGGTNVLLENNFFGDTTNNGSINDGYYALNYGSMTNLNIRNNTFAQGINENTGNTNVTLTGNILSTAWNCINATYRYNVYQWTSNLNCGATDKWVNGPQYSISNLGIIDEPNDDLHISSSSPARDFISAATASSLGLPNTDIDGQSRPINSSYDAGADEYGSGGSNPSPPPPPPAPSAPVVTISSSPSALQSGASSTLTWSATNSPSSCSASGDWSGTKATSGSQSTGALSTVKTYTYTLSCTNAGGTGSDSATVAVSASPPPPPAKPVITMSVSPSTINQGSSSTIAWSATNSPSSCNTSGDWSGSKSASGTQSTGALSNVKTYTYTLSCTNAGGTTTGSVSLVVIPTKPTVSLSLSPETINEGESANISWSTGNNPDTCTASGDWSGSKSASGGAETTGNISGASSKTYTITCSNSGGTASDSVSLSISTPEAPIDTTVPKPIVTLTAKPGTIEAGQKSTLTWKTSNSPSTCTASEGWSGIKSIQGGTENTAALSEGKTFTITCSNAGGSNSASVSVSVVKIEQSGEVKVNDKTVPNLKVDNPAIVGESKAGEIKPLSQESTNKTEVKTKLGLLGTTKGKLILAGGFAGIITAGVGTLFVSQHYFHWRFVFPFRWRGGKGPGAAPPGMISG